MVRTFVVQYPYGNNLGHTIEYYPYTIAGHRQAIQDLKYYKEKLNNMLEEKDICITELIRRNVELQKHIEEIEKGDDDA